MVKTYAEITRNVINKYSVMNLDMKELLEDLDIIIYETETHDYENNLTINKRDESYYLTVPKGFVLNENKFRLCSEIGNLIMHYESSDFSNMNQLKYESNEFAANFLLPEELLKKSNNEIVEFLANKGIITDTQTIGVYKNNMRIENNSIHKVKMNKQPKNRNF